MIKSCLNSNRDTNYLPSFYINSKVQMTLIEKIRSIKAILKSLDPNMEVKAEAHKDGGTATMYGPFPSFLLLLSETEEDRFLIHVNADAANMVYYMTELLRVHWMIHDGAFAIDPVDSSLIMGVEAYEKKESNILIIASEILAARQKAKQEQIIVPEQKIYLGE